MGTTNINREPSQVNYRYALYALLGYLLLSPLTEAATIQVTAEYKPAPYDINGSKFINTTPCSVPENMTGDFWCKGTASLENEQAIKIETTISSKLISNDGKLEHAITYQKFTGEKTVELTKKGSSKTHKMKFKLTKIGASQTPNLIKEAGETDNFWLYYVQGDCNFRLNTWASSSILDYFYDIKNANQQSGGICYNNKFNPKFTSSKNVTLQRIYIGYKLQPPDPLKMENGTYKGNITLSLGRNKDLDFGDATYSDSNVTIEFTLRVTHQLKLEFPAGSNKVILQPPKGWAPWMNSGKTPPNLKAELPFKFWFSAPFDVSLSYCQYQNNGQCQLKNIKNSHKTNIEISYINGIGKSVPLSTSKYHFTNTDGEYINVARKLLFEINKTNLTEMMKYPGSTYQGDVTIMFEAEIPPF
ncbi:MULTISPECIES: hypothetical protein [Shewanella]|uniref:Uncharacterized protein n=1 Tax=Shewanella oncorhynchi TaxID=2726434 RepID=A0ABX1KQ81_9GAMM|nr:MULTISPECIES: hypothetical protein [Shewanella]MBW3515918.1 hypothetical protein [Shewanella sp. NKUCC01_JLK]MCU8083721.1 hypothetical protein [Shewanella sp. SM23]NLQ24370.1 hypothetical protein [Shewanella oncorhynchi]